MAAKLRIAIVAHEHEGDFADALYFIRLIQAEWERIGHQVVLVRGISRFVAADVAVAHIDLTRVPEDYRDFLSRYRAVVNGNLTDISKSRFSQNLLRRADEWPGPVIVKSDLNSQGSPEAIVRWRSASRLRRHAMRAKRRIVTTIHGAQPKSDYVVYESFDAVPAECRADSRYVIERFLPEIDDGAYVLRLLFVLGSRGISAKARSPYPIVKSRDFLSHETVETPPGLIERARALGLDYGKIDYVIRDGEAVFFDVNRTPTCDGPFPLARNLYEARMLAPAIEEFV